MHTASPDATCLASVIVMIVVLSPGNYSYLTVLSAASMPCMLVGYGLAHGTRLHLPSVLPHLKALTRSSSVLHTTELESSKKN